MIRLKMRKYVMFVAATAFLLTACGGSNGPEVNLTDEQAVEMAVECKAIEHSLEQIKVLEEQIDAILASTDEKSTPETKAK